VEEEWGGVSNEFSGVCKTGAGEPEDRPEPVREMFRKTKLNNALPVPDENGVRILRSRMIPGLERHDPKIQHMQFEALFREFICSLMVRQYQEESELQAGVIQSGPLPGHGVER
jgi:hypothetical protein